MSNNLKKSVDCTIVWSIKQYDHLLELTKQSNCLKYKTIWSLIRTDKAILSWKVQYLIIILNITLNVK